MNEISYRLKWTEELYWQYIRFIATQMRRESALHRYDFLRRLGIFFIGLIVCIVIVAGTGGNAREAWSMWMGFGFGFFFYYLYVSAGARWSAADRCERAVSRPEVIITLDASGIKSNWEYGVSLTNWRKYTSIESFSGGLVLWDAVSCEGVPIPDDALPEGMDRKMASNLLETWKKAAA